MATFHGLDAIIQTYMRRNLPRLEAYLASYKQLTLGEALVHAAMAERFDELKGIWKRHDHQRRLKRESLKATHEALKGISLSACKSFHDLFVIIEKTIGGISGIGKLMVYDTSLRLGATVGFQPDRVYLHSGTRKGAKRLGLRADLKWLLPDQLPKDLRSLAPCQVEDLLCIYKDYLSPGGQPSSERIGKEKIDYAGNRSSGNRGSTSIGDDDLHLGDRIPGKRHSQTP